jgi:N-acetyl-gamma-glutamyl-phosphate reductase
MLDASREMRMKAKVFVDGQEGTTGLEIHHYLNTRTDIELLEIEKDRRKDPEARRKLLNAADLAFLCLPDAASRESISLVSNEKTRIIDASTAFRTDPAWTYGIPELNKGQRDAIRTSRRVTVPGCHATGYVLAVHPLVAEGIMPKNYPASCFSLTGYSGGGKKMIEQYQDQGRDEKMKIPRPYALKLEHKHLPEMHRWSGLASPPLFTPVVADYYRGMAVSVPLFPSLLAKKMTARDVREVLASWYAGEKFVRVLPFDPEATLDQGALKVAECNGTNRLDLFVFGGSERILVTARLDNLGKGASGAAIQNMNIMLGADEATGLFIDTPAET